MDTAKELQVLREELIREIDEKIGQMLKKLQNENGADHQKIVYRRRYMKAFTH